MPTLYISVKPNANNGINKILLSNPLRSQKMKLLTAVINKQGAGYNQSKVHIRIPFLSSNQFNSGEKTGYLTLSTEKSTKGIEVINFGLGLDLPCDHVNEVFECQLLDENSQGITNNTHFTSVDLYFSYETSSLF